MELLTLLGSIVAFIGIFSTLVLVHEWGHFTAARIFGVRVLEFGLGLPPKGRVLFKKGDTEYTLNWLPLGGFVRLFGENGENRDEEGSFASKPVWQRICIAIAGVFMNMVLAFVLLILFFMAGGRPLAVLPDTAYPFSQPSYLLQTESMAREEGILRPNPLATGPVQIEGVVPGSLAEKAGIVAGDQLLEVSGLAVKNSTEARDALLKAPIRSEITLRFTSGMRTLVKSEETVGLVLTSPLMIGGYTLSFPDALSYATKELGTQTTLLVSALGDLGGDIARDGMIPEEVGGPVKIAEAVHMANKAGWDALLVIAILLSVNLGVLNILPIPALDGGRIAFLLIEGILRRPLSRTWENYAHMGGYIFLMALMLLVTGKDLLGLFGG